MTKATHEGTCQICGSAQKLPSGVLSKHGYTVHWGFFSGVCQGQGHAPFEKSTAAIEGVIMSVKASLFHAKERRQARLANTETVMATMRLRVNGTTHHKTVELNADQITVDRYGSSLTSSHTEDDYLGTFKFSTIPMGSTDGDTKADMIVAANAYHVRRVLDLEIDQMEKYIVWQSERVANWVEQDLRPVEAVKPLLHFVKCEPYLQDDVNKIRVFQRSGCGRMGTGFKPKGYRELKEAGRYRQCDKCEAEFQRYRAARAAL